MSHARPMNPAETVPAAPVTVEAAGPERLDIRGGVGGIVFQWEELAAAAQQFRSLGDEVQMCVNELFEVQSELQRELYRGDMFRFGTTPAEPVGQRAAEALALTSARVADQAAALHDAAARITASRFAYEAAEAAAQTALAALGVDVDSGQTGAERILAAVNAAGAARPGTIEITRIGTAAGLDQVSVEPTVHGLLARVAVTARAGEGVLEVLEIPDDVSGAGRYVVVLPGTQRGSPSGGNPFDTTGIVEAIRYDSAYLARAVAQALEESGASPGGAVTLVGYSQGGMHAANLAANQGLRAGYDIRMVLTAGSPTAHTETGEGLHLHLEHADDWVPGTDLAANPDEGRRVTVQLHQPPAPVALPDKGLGPAHKLDTYLAGAASVDAGIHPSLVPVHLAAAAALGARAGGPVLARRHAFQLSRSEGPASNSFSTPGGTRLRR
jgi:pimeloyl-ACP methyl ester carboxylesterase